MNSLKIFLSLFLILFLFSNPSSALSGNGTFEKSGTATWGFELAYSSPYVGPTTYMNHIWFRDVDTTKDIDYITAVSLYSHFAGGSGNTSWSTVEYRIDDVGTHLGTGTIGYMVSGINVYTVAFFNDDFTTNISLLSGTQRIEIFGIDNPFRLGIAGNVEVPTTNSMGVCFADTGQAGYFFPTAAEFFISTGYSVVNTYTYDVVGNSLYYSIERDVGNKSTVNAINNGGIVTISENTIQSSNDEWYNLDILNTTWAVTWETEYGDTIIRDIIFKGIAVPSGSVDFNQSHYTNPEIVGVTWELNNASFANNEYWILLTGNNGGTTYFVTDDFYDITNTSGQDDFNISYSPLSLPFNMRAELWRYSYTSGLSSVLAYSDFVTYNKASMAPGSIWTDKSNYNISEMFYIEFDTNYNTVQIELVSNTFHDLRTMEGPGVGHLGYMFNTPHNFTAYLIEDGLKVNHVDFTVSADEPFLNIYLDSVPTKQLFCLEYFTDNTSDTITGYKPDGSIFYGPTSNLQTNTKTVLSGLYSNSPPGTYTVSLLHDGLVYYNDTIDMISKNEYVYFEGNEYETGDTIKIYSYVTDSRQKIRLSDSSGHAVISWTSANNYIIPNAPTVLYLSLTDSNEYGMDLETAIDAGTYKAGNWKIQVIDIDGQPLTDELTYDYATIRKAEGTPADQTNEFILLLFSPEGAFLILTAVLMLGGLAAAKHPAGGAAGAAVGVGFGVYMAVLPVWMLLLMVILLIVLAGVSMAVHFKGK